MKRSLLFTLFFLFFALVSFGGSNNIKVLILSGRNNHNWKSTTPKLKSIYEKSGLFEVHITETPETLNPEELKEFDVIVSNWNSFPEKDVRWSTELENALLNFIEEGGGFVTFHASTTCFYSWPEFRSISTGAWIEGTNHGKKSATQVSIQNNKHPITKGLQNFFIEDELWISAENNSSFEILGTGSNSATRKKGIENQPVIMVKEFGKGRIFHTTLGHDVRTMRNIGFKTLMLRGAEWTATGKVKQVLPQQLQVIPEGKFKWNQNDTTFALMNGSSIVWQYNFNEFHTKPFFHPINVGRNNLTCVSPDDHLWHVGQWFSWKYINGINYWEYKNGTYQSEGVTEITDIKPKLNDDFSAEINLNIVYHPIDSEHVLAEKRIIKIHPPHEGGNVSMDYSFEFVALVDSVDINRTPILGERDGKSWGGYAGLSLRFNQDFMDSEFISAWGENDSVNGKVGDWLYMAFTGLDGKKVGSQILIAPDAHRQGSAWYSVATNDLPFYYFSPAYLFNKSLLLLKGEKLVLNYQINHIAGETNKTALEQNFQDYKKEKNQ